MEARDANLTYVNYKVATDRLIAWLFDTASRSGIKPPDDRVNVKGNARQFKNANDYSRLAAVLVTHAESGVRLPPALAVVIRQAIELREVHAKKFPDVGRHRISNRRHRHFIEELKTVLELLETTKLDIDPGRLLSSTLCSRDIIPAVWPQCTGRRPSGSSPRLDCELGGSIFDDNLAICTFFEDMAAIRDDIHDTWKDYVTGDLCLTAAAVTTDTAFKIMMSSCEEIIQLIPDAPSWLALVMRFKEVTDHQHLEESDFLELTCVKVATLLNNLCQDLRPKHLLIKKPGRFGDYEPSTDRAARTTEDQDAEDAVILSELFVDVVVLSRADLPIPAQDHLTAGLRATVDGGGFESMPMYVIFAAQVFLDIHHLLRDGITRSLDSLQTAGKRAYDILGEHLRRRHGTSPRRKSTQAMEDIKVYVEKWLEEDIVGATLRRYGCGQAGLHRFRFLRNHPILCGLKVFRLQLLLQREGIEMANESGSIISAAHIYNAARQSGGLEQPWSDIDYIIKLHTSKRVFSGSPPSAAADFFDRFLLALNEGERSMYERLRLDSRTDSSRSNKQRIKLKATSPVRDTFESRYVLDGEARVTSDNVVAMSHVARKKLRTTGMSEDTGEFLRDMAAKRIYSTMELLRIVREGVAAEELHLLFDYIGLHDRGMELLDQIDRTFHDGLDLSSTSTAVLDGSHLMLNVARLFDVVNELERSATDPVLVLSSNIVKTLALTVSNFLGERHGTRYGSASIGPARVLTNASLVAQWKVVSPE